MCIIMTQIIMADKLSIQITKEDNTWLNIRLTLYCPRWSRQVVITVSRSTWMTTKINGVATDLFCTSVIGNPGYNLS